MFDCTATMRPPAIATSAMALTRCEGSITRPPLMIRSIDCASTFKERVNSAVPAAAWRNRRRFTMGVVSRVGVGQGIWIGVKI